MMIAFERNQCDNRIPLRGIVLYGARICIVACCPGGTASNLVTYLARADVALSVAMTTVSTMLAVLATPILTKILVGTLVPVSIGALLLSTLQVQSASSFHCLDN